jgi:hypothetical protein
VNEGQRITQIDADLVARQAPGRDDWEIRDSGVTRGRVVKTASGFQALKPGPDDGYYSIGTFVTLESAGKALRRVGLDS